MTEQKELINILKDAINDKKNDVKNYNNRLDQNLSRKMQLMDNLKQDVNEITKLDMNEINEIITLFPMEEEEKVSLKKELDVIKALLTLNQTEKTNYTLLPNQLEAVTKFIEYLEEYIEKKNIEKQSLDPEYNHIMVLTNKYKDLLSKLKKPNNSELISDVDTILQLFQENNIGEDEKQAILLSLIKYNQEIIAKKETKINNQGLGITDSELKFIFERYGYNFNKLEKKYQLKLKREGNRKNIEEVFNAMQKEGFSKLNEESSGLRLCALLLASTKENITTITSLAQERGINITTIEKLVSAFISNNYRWDGKYKVGKKEDFQKNLSLLAEHGISIPVVADKEKEVLIISHTKLQKNLEWLERYGLYTDTIGDTLLDDFLSALTSQNIPENIDLWIESHPLGIQYIRDNLSALSSYLSCDSLLFYKLYLSQKKPGNMAFRLTVSNGIKKLHLKKEINKDSISYYGITNIASAKNIVKKKEIHFAQEKEYIKCAKQSLKDTISDNIFNYPFIVALNRFSDSSESLLYDIHGIKISKLKVLRLYDSLYKNGLGNTVDSLLFSIFYQKIVSEEEYHWVMKEVMSAIDTEGEII